MATTRIKLADSRIRVSIIMRPAWAMPSPTGSEISPITWRSKDSSTRAATPETRKNFSRLFTSSSRDLREKILPNPLIGSSLSRPGVIDCTEKIKPPMEAGPSRATTTVSAKNGTIISRPDSRP